MLIGSRLMDSRDQDGCREHTPDDLSSHPFQQSPKSSNMLLFSTSCHTTELRSRSSTPVRLAHTIKEMNLLTAN